MAKINKRGSTDRRPLKVNVSESEEINTEDTIEETAETPVDTVEENNSEAVENVEEAIAPVEEKTSVKKSSVKEYTEEQLVIMTREDFDKASAEIKAGKAVLIEKKKK